MIVNVTDEEYIEEGKAVKRRKIKLFGLPLYKFKCISSNSQVIRMLSTNNKCIKVKGFKNEIKDKGKKD